MNWYLKRHVIDLGGAEVFWGWVASEALRGRMGVEGPRPVPGIGGDRQGWMAQARVEGGWGEAGEMEGNGWVMYRVRLLQALRAGQEEGEQLTWETVQQLWINSMGRITTGEGRAIGAFYRALVELEELRQLECAEGLVEKMTAYADRAGLALSGTAEKEHGGLERNVLVDLFSGSQSARWPAKQRGFRYVSVDVRRVIAAQRKVRTQCVLDLEGVSAGELLRTIAELAGIEVGEILVVWASPPCTTFNKADSAMHACRSHLAMMQNSE